MNLDIKALFEKQAAWQHSRAARPWAEKLRASVAMRASLRALRKPTARRGPETFVRHSGSMSR